MTEKVNKNEELAELLSAIDTERSDGEEIHPLIDTAIESVIFAIRTDLTKLRHQAITLEELGPAIQVAIQTSDSQTKRVLESIGKIGLRSE